MPCSSAVTDCFSGPGRSVGPLCGCGCVFFGICYHTVVLSVCPVCDVGVLWPSGLMDQDETWRGGRSWPRPHCVRWGPSSPTERGTAAPSTFRPVSIVAKRSPVSATAELLFICQDLSFLVSRSLTNARLPMQEATCRRVDSHVHALLAPLIFDWMGADFDC